MNNNIAILLPHYNNLKGLLGSLESLLNEDVACYTLFIFDDGSKDINKVKKIANKYSSLINIELIINNENLGITKTLNEGLKYIISLEKFSFIARLDAGDFCINNRLKKQANFLKDHPDVGLLGSWVDFVDMNRRKIYTFKPPSEHEKLKKIIHVYNPFIHPSVMMRIDAIKKIGFYPSGYPALEDHAFFFKFIKKSKTYILNEVLIEYEINPSGISLSNREVQTKSRIKLLYNEYVFGYSQTIGLIRSLITFILPQKLLLYMKKIFF